jgi:hypothetical protein
MIVALIGLLVLYFNVALGPFEIGHVLTGTALLLESFFGVQLHLGTVVGDYPV